MLARFALTELLPLDWRWPRGRGDIGGDEGAAAEAGEVGIANFACDSGFSSLRLRLRERSRTFWASAPKKLRSAWDAVVLERWGTTGETG